MEKNKLLAVVFLGIFLLFIACFLIAGVLIQNGLLPPMQPSPSVQGILASVFCFPLIASGFFLGQHIKRKPGIAQTIYKVLTFVVIALFMYMCITLIVSVVGLIIS